MPSSTAVALPNIALIKYWGDRDPLQHIPANGSISLNLDGLFTRTQVTFNSELISDRFSLNSTPQNGQPLIRVSALLDRVRRAAGIAAFAEVVSHNNFPTGAGIASSASAFAALSLAASAAAGLSTDEASISRLARTGSGSACRSVPGGWVEWQAGMDDADSYAYSIAAPDHWPIVDCIAIVDRQHKSVTSREGHSLADTSPLQAARVADAPRRLDLCRQAVLNRDFEALADISELDCHLMHAVMMTSSPRLLYWQPATLTIMHAVQEWRKKGIPVFYTIDAGPNVHVLTMQGEELRLKALLEQIPGVDEILLAPPGGAARLEPLA